jgi:NAD(P) transhydrogenase subunit alpha
MAFLWQKSHHFREAMGDDFTRAQLATYARVVPDMDVIITTAMIPNRSAPELITAEMVVPHLISLLFVDRNGSK